MVNTWNKVFDYEVGGRTLKGEIFDEGGYKISTTQKCDCEGKVVNDDCGTSIFPPSFVGSKIVIDSDTLENLEKELIEYGEFTAEEAKKIISKF